MSKHKFKVGDLVVLKDNIKAGDYINGVTIMRSMYRDLKNPCRIKHIYENNAAYIDRWIFPLCVLKPFHPEKIIIYRNGGIAESTVDSLGNTGSFNQSKRFAPSVFICNAAMNVHPAVTDIRPAMSIIRKGKKTSIRQDCKCRYPVWNGIRSGVAEQHRIIPFFRPGA